MKTLLRIDCSSRIIGSHSRELADFFEGKWIAENPDGMVIRRDLVKQPLPHIQNNTIEGFYTPIQFATSEIKEATALSDELISELKSAHEVLISSPLYNLNIPSNLKAYFDQVVRIGHTFDIYENGYNGLLENKKAFIITAKGGVYKGTSMEKFDFQESYLKAILGHMGIKTQEIFSLEGTSESKIVEKNKLALHKEINQSLKK
ncbi:FMN-dependent NADH-azoreductase [Maribacter vaceletii]|uniref:FMN dependent NADH:quinone oxidoreductase n=1 Tax=Maribacter vaceletii TaxID=1206816 RepID=A0A495DW88_9FLAO|nr:NAD(P)H-dependent oxidoreductase [Maribacter vaceletii]RKR07867.1 FMN-dependent NADH-azoreductase [Maribacter vaceletii]